MSSIGDNSSSAYYKLPERNFFGVLQSIYKKYWSQDMPTVKSANWYPDPKSHTLYDLYEDEDGALIYEACDPVSFYDENGEPCTVM